MDSSVSQEFNRNRLDPTHTLATKIIFSNCHSFPQSQPDDSREDEDEKHYLEGEAEETDNDFIDDDDQPDETDSDAVAETRSAIKALRNRRVFKETHLSCPLCKDLRNVLRHLLALE